MEVQSSRFKAQRKTPVSSTLNVELLTEVHAHCARPERLAPRALLNDPGYGLSKSDRARAYPRARSLWF
jgi:hypothetical protein